MNTQTPKATGAFRGRGLLSNIIISTTATFTILNKRIQSTILWNKKKDVRRTPLGAKQTKGQIQNTSMGIFLEGFRGRRPSVFLFDPARFTQTVMSARVCT